MDTVITYQYLTPGAPSPNNTTITTTTRRVGPDEAPTLHLVGDVITLVADDPEVYGDQPREYEVRYRFPILVQFGDPGFSLSALLVIVTDA